MNWNKFINFVNWVIEPLLGRDGKPSIRNISAAILLYRLINIDECSDIVNGTYITTLALLITGLLGLKVADNFISKISNKNDGNI